jgi:N-acetylmuramoyl-L-alanine amidase
MFQDNKEDVDWLLSEEGRKAITDIHVKGIKKYIASL